jgi:hypothetical protein
VDPNRPPLPGKGTSISKGKIGVKTVDVLACVVPSYSALGRR